MNDWIQKGTVVLTKGPNDHYVGRIVMFLSDSKVELEEASWVADSGRLSEFVKNGRTDNMEIEPVGRVVTTFNDIIEWPHKLFTEAI